MVLGVVFTLMTAMAAFAVLWPLSRRWVPSGGSDIEVYRDQLDEITRDRAVGLIGDPEAEAARIEICHRLMAADDMNAAERTKGPNFSSLWARRIIALTALILLPIGAAALYIVLGSPQLPGEPLAARLRDLRQNSSIASLISRVERHLQTHPDDARGYELLAPVYMSLRRFDDAVNVRRKLLTLKGEDAEREADLGEALTAAAHGVVTVEAKAAFERAIALDTNEYKAEFFMGLAAEQDGDITKAAAQWHNLLNTAPRDSSWAGLARQALAKIDGAASWIESMRGPTAQDITAAAGMNAKDRNDMIRGMVARLADRLKQNGDDVQGWQQLLRAYIALGERDKAHTAARDAKRALANDPDKSRLIEDTIKQMGLQG